MPVGDGRQARSIKLGQRVRVQEVAPYAAGRVKLGDVGVVRDIQPSMRSVTKGQYKVLTVDFGLDQVRMYSTRVQPAEPAKLAGLL